MFPSPWTIKAEHTLSLQRTRCQTVSILVAYRLCRLTTCIRSSPAPVYDEPICRIISDRLSSEHQVCRWEVPKLVIFS